MARITLILSVITALIALLGGFRVLRNQWRLMKLRRREMGKWLMVLTLCLVPSWADAAGRIFYDGSEAGNTDLWQQDGSIARCTSVTSATDAVLGPYAGSRMIRCNFNGSGSSLFQALKLDTSDYTTELFLRMRYRPDTNLDRTDCGGGNGCNAFKLIRYFQTAGTYHDLFEVAGHPIDSNRNAGNANNSTTMPTYWGGDTGDNTNLSNAWHKIEYYFHQSSGIVKVWHDGVLVRDDSGYNFQGVKWTDFYLGSNGDLGGDATNHWYIDEFEVYSDNGTGGTGTMSDASITQGGGGSSSTIVLFLEWIPLVLGLCWHFRKPIIGAVLVCVGFTKSVTIIAAQEAKQFSYQISTQSVQTVAKILEKAKR